MQMKRVIINAITIAIITPEYIIYANPTARVGR